MLYRGSDVSLDIPDAWQDRTITAFSAPAKANQTVAPNIVLTRDTVPDGEDVVKYADRQLVELARNLAGFNLDDRREVQISGLSGMELSFRWTGASGTVRQKQTFVMTNGRKLFTFVVTAAEADFGEMEPYFTAILASARIHHST